VKALLANGADANERTGGGQTPLILATIFGHTHLIPLLLDAGADPQVRDNLGLNAIDWAQRRGATEALAVLSNIPTRTQAEFRAQTPPPRSTPRAEVENSTSVSQEERSRRWIAGLKQRIAEQSQRDLPDGPNIFRAQPEPPPETEQPIAAAEPDSQPQREPERASQPQRELERASQPQRAPERDSQPQRASDRDWQRASVERISQQRLASVEVEAHSRLADREPEPEIPSEPAPQPELPATPPTPKPEIPAPSPDPKPDLPTQPSPAQTPESQSVPPEPVAQITATTGNMPRGSSTRKRCPKCNAVYNSDLISYCAHHIVRLVDDVDQPIISEPQSTTSPALFWMMIIVTLIGSVAVGSIIAAYFYGSKPVQPAVTASQTSTVPVQKGTPVVGKELEGKVVALPVAECPLNGQEAIPGTVVVRVTVLKTGQVKEAFASGGDWLLRGAATEAAMKSSFAPEKLRGRDTEGTITYIFGP
jgi:hypothetical protein